MVSHISAGHKHTGFLGVGLVESGVSVVAAMGPDGSRGVEFERWMKFVGKYL